MSSVFKNVPNIYLVNIDAIESHLIVKIKHCYHFQKYRYFVKKTIVKMNKKVFETLLSNLKRLAPLLQIVIKIP